MSNRKGLVRSVLVMAFVGFLVVTLAGPVLTLLGLALVGYIVCALARALYLGQGPTWEKFRGGLGSLVRNLFRVVRFVAVVMIHELSRLLRELVLLGRSFATKASAWGGAAWDTILGAGSALGVFLVEVLSGTILGGLLGLAVAWRHDFRPEAIGIGAAIGAGLGILVGIVNWRAARQGLPSS